MPDITTAIEAKKPKLNKPGKIILIISLTLAIILLISGIVTLITGVGGYTLRPGGRLDFRSNPDGNIKSIRYTATSSGTNWFYYSGMRIIGVEGTSSWDANVGELEIYCVKNRTYTIMVMQISYYAYIED